MSTNNTKSKIKSAYSKALQKHGIGIKALRWTNYKSSFRRYHELVNDIAIENTNILDVGCGFGDIIPYLLSKNPNFIYKGIDIMPEFIEEAKKRYPDFEFTVQNIWDDSFQEKFDFIITSGTLNSINSDIEDRKDKIKKLFSLSKKGIVFNMAGKHPIPSSLWAKPTIGVVDAMDILQYCFTLSPHVIFRHHYHERDFTISLFHEEQNICKSN